MNIDDKYPNIILLVREANSTNQYIYLIGSIDKYDWF